jgi:NAD+ kinase
MTKLHFTGVPDAQDSLAELRARYGEAGPEEAEIVVALGGDGFMLQTLHAFTGKGKPIYGMNRGTVGFLMNEYHQSDLLERLTVRRTGDDPSPQNDGAQAPPGPSRGAAFNEVSLLRETRQAAKIRIAVDGKPRILELICDGVLVSTAGGLHRLQSFRPWPNPADRCRPFGAHPDLGFPSPPLARRAVAASRQVRFEVLESAKRPVSAVADDFEVRDVTAVDVAEDRAISMTMLYDAGHNLDERILAEQFSD